MLRKHGNGGEATLTTRVERRAAPRHAYQRFFKPVVDRIGGILFTLVSLPIAAFAGVLIWTSLGRPILFKQQRVGRGGSHFTVFKFRTMHPDRRRTQEPFSGPDRRVNHKSAHDPRLTPTGRFLRKWSLDEIPQFWNVARGDMSLVGPRPELLEIVARYEPWQHRRHDVKPGVTGLWQISGRSDVPMHEATATDLEYVDDVSLRGDLKILLKTLPAVLGDRKGH